VPLIYEAHGFPSIELPYHFPALRGRVGLLGRIIEEENLLLRRARWVITPSRTGARYLHSRGVEPARIRVLANSVCAPDFSWREGPAWEAPFRLLYLGTLAPWQGLETVVEALRHLRHSFPLRLQLAGTRKGPWLRRLRRLASSLGERSNLELLGPLAGSGLRAAMESAHLTLAPLPDDPRNSVQGCCPIKILEYMAAGKPILATRTAPVEELLEHGQTGWLVAPNSPKALADGLAHILRHPELARSLGEQARRRVAQRFSRENFEDQWAGLLGA
jgi:glycosyltransferase involved in cell wall biosynthesis